MNVPSQDKIVLAHGGGGEMTRRLLDERVLPKVGNALLDPLTDGALLGPVKGRLCLTTDAYVVQPLVFPGGDIGRLAVCGTVNDLAVMGARPLALTLALVMEEGLPMAVLDRVMDSVAAAAEEAGVPVATGDTKVVEHVRGDGMIVTTAGLGELQEGVRLDSGSVEAGDILLVTGLLAEHGLAVMSARENLGIETKLKSDAAPLWGLVEALLGCGGGIRFLRDPTRSGLAGVAADLVEETGLSLEISEEALPISPGARHLAEVLGLDPLTVANEGKIVAVVGAAGADRVLGACRDHPLGRHGGFIGRFVEGDPPLAELMTRVGGRRIIHRPYGEELPRIC